MYILRSQIILQPKRLEAPSHSHSQVECDLALPPLTSITDHSLKTNYRESGFQYVTTHCYVQLQNSSYQNVSQRLWKMYHLPNMDSDWVIYDSHVPLLYLKI